MNNQPHPGFNGQNMQWTDQDMIGDLLAQEKQLIGMYGTMICEGSNQAMRQLLNNNMNAAIDSQFKIFQQMQQRGWYQTTNATPQDIQSAKQKTTQTKNQMM